MGAVRRFYLRFFSFSTYLGVIHFFLPSERNSKRGTTIVKNSGIKQRTNVIISRTISVVAYLQVKAVPDSLQFS